MQKLSLDTGVQEYEVNGRHFLRFNPSDPNVYERYLAAANRIQELEGKYSEKTKAVPSGIDKNGFPVEGGEVLRLMRELDLQVKQELTDIFGAENDFDQIFDGVNIMAVTSTGERIITNFFNAIKPILEKGTQQYISQKTQATKQNRAERRAVK